MAEWQKKLLTETRRRARQKGLPFTLTSGQLARLLRRAGGRCEVTYRPFDHEYASKPGRDGKRRRPFIPSIDRINPDLGYTYENCRVVCCAANLCMNLWGEGVFIQMAVAFLLRVMDDLLAELDEEMPEFKK